MFQNLKKINRKKVYYIEHFDADFRTLQFHFWINILITSSLNKRKTKTKKLTYQIV